MLKQLRLLSCLRVLLFCSSSLSNARFFSLSFPFPLLRWCVWCLCHCQISNLNCIRRSPLEITMSVCSNHRLFEYPLGVWAMNDLVIRSIRIQPVINERPPCPARTTAPTQDPKIAGGTIGSLARASPHHSIHKQGSESQEVSDIILNTRAW